MPHRRRELSRALAEAKAAGRTTADVAADARIARATLSRILNGHRTPHRLTREALAAALGRPAEDLFPEHADADTERSVSADTERSEPDADAGAPLARTPLHAGVSEVVREGIPGRGL